MENIKSPGHKNTTVFNPHKIALKPGNDKRENHANTKHYTHSHTTTETDIGLIEHNHTTTLPIKMEGKENMCENSKSIENFSLKPITVQLPACSLLRKKTEKSIPLALRIT